MTKSIGVQQTDQEGALCASQSTFGWEAVPGRTEILEPRPLPRSVGILVGTLGVAGYQRAIAAVRDLAQRAGKKTYTLLMGKPSPVKLANFPEIEASSETLLNTFCCALSHLCFQSEAQLIEEALQRQELAAAAISACPSPQNLLWLFSEAHWPSGFLHVLTQCGNTNACSSLH